MAAQYHTARFRLVPRPAKALAVPVPPLRRPGSAWYEMARPASPGAGPAGHVRIGYARASTARQSLNPQADALRASGVTRIFHGDSRRCGHDPPARPGSLSPPAIQSRVWQHFAGSPLAFITWLDKTLGEDPPGASAATPNTVNLNRAGKPDRDRRPWETTERATQASTADLAPARP